MRPDKLEQLLRQADRGAGPPPPLQAGLAGRVRARSLHRQRAADRWASVAACLVAGLTVAWVLHHRKHADTPIARNSDVEKRELTEIAEAAQRIRLQFAAETIDTKSDLEQHREVAPAHEIDEKLEQTAFLVVYQGDRYHRDLNQPKAAVNSYQTTIRLFPQTQAARIAKARLQELQTEREKTS